LHRISVLRFVLALMVVVQHIGGLLIGTVAVEAFFAISGFLVTMIATTTYEGRPFAYLANRALRIFPVYWACLAVGAAVLWLVPDVHLSVALRWPESTVQAISQVTIFGLPMTDEYPKILPPAWSLHTELWLYLVIGLITAHSPRLTLFLVPVSTAIALLAGYDLLGGIPFYGHPIGNAHAFFVGSAAWQFRQFLSTGHRNSVAAGIALVFAGLIMVISERGSANVLIAAPFLVGAFLVAAIQAPRLEDGRAIQFYDLLGKLSYPVFLLHFAAGMVVAAVTGLPRGYALLALTTPVLILASLAVYLAVERPIERLRTAIRAREQVAATRYPILTP
jgi:peptidoglycan/LPS O-acetylase OafA/YrhL